MAANDIELVRERVEIVDLVGETVQLKKAGRSYKGLCPFHAERTPSFSVDPERQSWRCWGACSTGGDVFSFIMRRDGLEFGEALRTLAERAGVSLSHAGVADAAAAHGRLFDANAAAIAFFQQALLGSSAGEEARAYAARRGLDAATLAAFEIGYAPDGWEHLRGFLHGKGFVDEELIEAGLLKAGERGSAYDLFRRRLIFPIRDERGRAIGFGGRALDDAKPKYLNTPATPIFDKSGTLFALHHAKDAVRSADEAVIVEGYLDAITAHQFGYRNVVATLGTALTERHIQLLRRFTRRVTFAMDADTAGLEAAVRGEEVARAAGAGEGGRGEAVVTWEGLVRVQARAPVEVRVFAVPSGKDPDEAIREQPEAWPDWVRAAAPPFEFRLQLEQTRTNLRDPRARVELADRMLPLLLQVGDRALQASYLSKLAVIAAVPEATLAGRLSSLTAKNERGEQLRGKQTVARLQSGQAVEPRSRMADPTESFVLALLLRHPALRETGEVLLPDLFEQAAHQQIFVLWRDWPDYTWESLPDELQPVYAMLQQLRMPPFAAPDAELALINAVQKLRMRTLIEQKRLVGAELREIEDEADAAAAVLPAIRLLHSTAEPVGEAPASVAVVAGHLREDEYLMHEIHALEREQRTGHAQQAGGAAAAGSAAG